MHTLTKICGQCNLIGIYVCLALLLVLALSFQLDRKVDAQKDLAKDLDQAPVERVELQLFLLKPLLKLFAGATFHYSRRLQNPFVVLCNQIF